MSNGKAASGYDWGDGTLKNPIEFREWFKILFRQWRPHLSPNEFLVILFVFDRTAGWGKEWEIITQKQLLEGVTGRDGKTYATGLVMSPNTLRTALTRLKEVAMLLTREVGKRTAYSLNFEWSPETIANSDTMSLATPKRLQSLQPQENLLEKGAKINPSMGAKINPKYKKKEMLRKSMVSLSEKPGEQPEEPEEPLIDEAIEGAVSRARASRARKVARWTAASAMPAWTDACRRFQPEMGHLAVTKTDGVILHRYGKRFMAAGKGCGVPDWLAYLEWCITHWSLLRDSLFGWMQASSPAVPSIRFFVRFGEKFQQAWINKAETERLAAMPLREREIARRIAKGVTKEVAEREVDDVMNLTKERQRLERAAATVKRERIASESVEAERIATEQRKARLRTVRKPLDGEGTFEAWT